MGLTYHFKLSAPANRTAAELKAFLRTVELDAKHLGFNPTMVLDAAFDSSERREFARRLTHGFILESEALKTGVGLGDGQVWHLDSVNGSCRVTPEHGVVLVVTDEQHCETIFGFFKYPAVLKDIKGRDVVQTGADRWTLEDFVKSPDPRFRALVKKFAEAGYVEAEQDDFGVVLES